MRLIVQTRCGKCSIIRCTGDFWLDSSRWSLKLFQAGSNISAVYNSSALLFCNLSSKGNALLFFCYSSFLLRNPFGNTSHFNLNLPLLNGRNLILNATIFYFDKNTFRQLTMSKNEHNGTLKR